MSPLALLLVPLALIFLWAGYHAVRSGIEGERAAVREEAEQRRRHK